MESKQYARRAATAVTVGALAARLQEYITARPEMAAWPIHVMDMHDNGGPGWPEMDDQREGLVTIVETDKFSEEQSWVVSLISDWSERGNA